jgi:hypothetical protein
MIVEPDDREWDPKKLDQMRNLQAQTDLFSPEAWRETFRVIPKLPYAFSYEFVDSAGKESTLQILDWEIGALYWNCLQRHRHNEQIALQKVREKYFNEFLKTDLHLFLGTTQQYHQVAPNPWVILGVFPIPHQTQGQLF